MDWKSFTNLPDGLLNSPHRPLTWNWLHQIKLPLPEHFGLTDQTIASSENIRRVWLVRKIGLLTLCSVAFSIFLGFIAHFKLGTSEAESHAFEIALVASSVFYLVGIACYSATRRWLSEFDAAHTQRDSYDHAVRAIAPIQKWRTDRCERRFWQKPNLTYQEFEYETAELLAGILATKSVALTRGSNDYGADALACDNPLGKVVVQCKHWENDAKAASVRELAGSTTFLEANAGILFCLNKPDPEDAPQWEHFAERFNLTYWNLDCILHMTNLLTQGRQTFAK
jgi:hypothetical protein